MGLICFICQQPVETDGQYIAPHKSAVTPRGLCAGTGLTPREDEDVPDAR